MGMDLVGCKPKNESGASLHFNWTGWRFIGNLLVNLGCDTSEMSGANDGERIKAATCKEWAKAITSGLEQQRIYFYKIQDNSYFGGYREGVKVFKKEELPENVKTIKGLLLIEEQEFYINQDEIDWLNGIANFFQNCGGCRQY